MVKRSLWWAIILLVILGSGLAACGKDKTPASYTTLSVQKAYDQLRQSRDALIVDVRNPDEWATTGVLPGATLIPLPEFEQRAPRELSKDRPIYVICNSGNRSRAASDILIKLGYKHVFNIDGGIQAWLSAGLPVVPYTA
jgi:rhodanese-related sulfurtransferase